MRCHRVPIIATALLLSLTAAAKFSRYSILALIWPDEPDAVKAQYYREIGENSDNPDTVLKYSTLSLECCQESDLELIAQNYSYVRWAYYMKDEYRASMRYAIRAIEVYEAQNDKQNVAVNYINIGKCYHELNIRDSVFFYFNKALDIYLELKDTLNVAYTYQSMGLVNFDWEFKSAAQDYFRKALQCDSLSGNYLDMAYDYQLLGTAERDHRKAVGYLKKSVALFDSTPTDDPYYNSLKYNTYQYLAEAYVKLARETSESVYADSSYLYIKKIGRRNLDLGEYRNYVLTQFTYVKYLSFCGRDKEALASLLDCRQYIDLDEGDKVILKEYYEYLTEIYKKLGDYRNALECSDKMHEYRLSYANDSTLSILARSQSEEAVKIKDLKNQAEKRQLTTIITSLCIGLLLVVVLVVLIFRMLRVKKKANEQLSIKNAILDRQNNEIIAQRNKIEEVNQNLFSSINYAKRIQSAAISAKAEVDSVFPQNFVFYRPRDIVSGDYYRVAQCGKYRVMVTADCTGHGIPGAFLSMLGISALKEFCVGEADAARPGVILDRMRDFIKATLVSDTSDSIADGMDMTICSFDFEAMVMHYAMANHTAYIVRRGEAIKLVGDRMPVGRYLAEKEHFQTFTVALEPGDMIYSFSDGIQDQVGGDLDNTIGRKFLKKNLIAFLAANYDKPLDIQCQLLDDTITQWSNGREQIDDMTLIGILVE